MEEDLILKLRDPRFYLENFCRIKGKQQGALIPFILNQAQLDIFNHLKTESRIAICKCRQGGVSTSICGWAYHQAITVPCTNAALIGYNTDLTSELLDKIKTFWSTTPEELRPTIQYSTKYEITFPKLNSKILVLPSTETVGRGYTLNVVLGTETAFWRNANDKMAAIESSVPLGGKIIQESTPSSVGTYFHRTLTTENNGYCKLFYGPEWFYTKEDLSLIERRINDPRKFAREYLMSFDTSGMPVFDREIIRKQRSSVKKIGDKIKLKDGTDWTVIQEEGGLIVYRPPDKDMVAVAGADIGAGVVGGDFSVVHFFDRITGEEVAMYRGHIAPDVFGTMLDTWGRRYNCALMVVEINNHGLTTATILKQKCYPNLYYRPSKFDVPGMDISDRIGWLTNTRTKDLMINTLRVAARDGSIIIRSKELVDEMEVLTFDETRMRPDGYMPASAPPGFNDDTVMAAAMAVMGFNVTVKETPSQLDYRLYLPSNSPY